MDFFAGLSARKVLFFVIGIIGRSAAAGKVEADFLENGPDASHSVENIEHPERIEQQKNNDDLGVEQLLMEKLAENLIGRDA